jgi:hypothetical protein
MARQRFIWPDIWADPTFGRMPPIEQVFFIGCFSKADDDGRLLGDPRYLRSEIFPYGEVSAKRVKQVRDTVVKKMTSLVLYEANGVEVLALLKWGDYQKPKYAKPSKLPPPFPEASPNTSEVKTEASPIGLDRVGLDRVGLGWNGMDRDARASVVVPIEPLDRLLREIRDKDEGTGKVLASYGLPPAAFHTARELLLEQRATVRSDVRFVVDHFKRWNQEGRYANG